MDEAAIQEFLRVKGSRLHDLYFFANQLNMDDLRLDTNPIYSSQSNAGWPPVFIDVNRDGIYKAADLDIYIVPQNGTQYPSPPDGATGVPFAHVLAAWCTAFGVNPRVMLTHIQAEVSLISNPDAGNLQAKIGRLMNYSPFEAPWAWPSVQIGFAVQKSREFFDNAPAALPIDDQPHPAVPGLPFPVAAYQQATARRDPDKRFAVAGPVDMPASFFVQTRAAFALFTYTNQVNKSLFGGSGTLGGGNYVFMQLWAQYGFDR